MLGTLGACLIEIMPLEIKELEMTNLDSTRNHLLLHTHSTILNI